MKPRVTKGGVSTLRSTNKHLTGAVGVVIANANDKPSEHGVVVLWSHPHGLCTVSLGEFEAICDVD